MICLSKCHARVVRLPSRTRHARLCRIYYFLQNNWRKAHSTSLVLIQISSIQKNEAFTFHWPVCRARGHVVFFSWCHSLPSHKPMKSQEPNEREIVVSWWKLTRQASKMLRGAILSSCPNFQRTRPTPIPTHLAKVKFSVSPAVHNSLGDKWTLGETDSSEMFNIGYSVSSSLIGSLNSSYQLICHLTSRGNLSCRLF